jgi:hypothetical protein
MEFNPIGTILSVWGISSQFRPDRDPFVGGANKLFNFGQMLWLSHRLNEGI